MTEIPQTPEAAEARIVALVNIIEAVRAAGDDTSRWENEIAEIKKVYGNRHVTGVAGGRGPQPPPHHFKR